MYPTKLEKSQGFISKKHVTVTIIASFPELGISASLFPPLIQVDASVDGKLSFGSV